MGKVSIGFVAGTQVITDKGEKNIEYVKTGDMVLTHMGVFQRVIESKSRIYRGDIIQFGVFRKPDIRCDGDTQFFSQNESGERIWKPARDIKPKDLLCVESNDENGTRGEWVKVKTITRIGSSCRYLYGIDVEEDSSFTANGYIVNGLK